MVLVNRMYGVVIKADQRLRCCRIIDWNNVKRSEMPKETATWNLEGWYENTYCDFISVKH